MGKIKETADTSNNQEQQIRVKVEGGFLVAERNPDPDYNGITLFFETDNGDFVDLALAECKAEDGYKKTQIYMYEDVWDEDYTRKFSIDHEELCRAISDQS